MRTPEFRGVFAFGPVAKPRSYGQDKLAFDVDDEKESFVRSPIHFLADIRSPTYVIEGDDGNVGSLRELAAATTNKNLVCVEIGGADHFNLLAPLNAFIAKEIAKHRSSRPFLLEARGLQRAFESPAR